jgi:hypothetical protein
MNLIKHVNLFVHAGLICYCRSPVLEICDMFVGFMQYLFDATSSCFLQRRQETVRSFLSTYFQTNFFISE